MAPSVAKPPFVGQDVTPLQSVPRRGKPSSHLRPDHALEKSDVADSEKEKELSVLLQADEHVTLNVVQL
jgi:hypothetical protein